MGIVRRLIAVLPRSPLERVRLLLLVSNLIAAAVVVERIMSAEAASDLLKAAGVAALALLMASWIEGYRRGRLHPARLAPEALAYLVISAPLGGPLGILGLIMMGLAFRSLYGENVAGLLPTLAYAAMLGVGAYLAPLYATAAGWTYSLNQLPAFLFGPVMVLLHETLRRQDLAFGRQQALNRAGAALVAADSREAIVAEGLAAAQALSGERRVQLVEDDSGELNSSLRLPLVGHRGPLGVLLIDGLEPLPPETQQSLQALLTLIALRLEAFEEGWMRQERAESKVEELSELNQLKDDLLNSVSYELRSPLTSIRAYSELLLTYQDAAVQREFLEIINSESERLARLVSDVLDLTHIQSGSFQWNISAVDVPALLNDAARIYRPLIAREGLEFDVGAEAGLPPVSGDRDRLLQVIGNLLHNALKFTIRGSVGLAAYHAGQEVHIAVSDTGLGVPAAERERIFEKFHQAGQAPAGKAPGTGLGLAICRHIVEHHGGRIWVTPAPRGGSVFTFALPAMAAEPEREAPAPEPASEPKPAPSAG